MNAKRQTTVDNRNTMARSTTLTASRLIRWTGLAALVAGIIYVVIQPIHPADVPASVTTPVWAIIQSVKLAMCLLFLLGIIGLYARQVNEAGWLGLAGVLLLSLSWVLQAAFIFSFAFLVPVLAPAAPQVVESFLGIINGHPGAMSLGALPALYALVGVLYILGGLVFAIATLRAGVLPRWPAWLLAVAAAVTPAAALIPHPLNRILAVPMGLALAWLGYALWAEQREAAAHPVPGSVSPQRQQSAAE